MGGPFEAGSALIRMIRSWRFDLSRSVNWNETLFKELAMKKVGKKVTKKVGGGKPAPPVTKSAPTVESGDLGPAQTGTGDEVNVQVGKTINLGNYETLRVDVGARVRVNSGETFNDAFNRAREMVLQRTQEMIAEVKSTFSE